MHQSEKLRSNPIGIEVSERDHLNELMNIIADLPPHEQNNMWFEVREQILRMRHQSLERLKEDEDGIKRQIMSLEQVIKDFAK